MRVFKSHVMSMAYIKSGILHSYIRSICTMLVYPNVRFRHTMSSRGFTRPDATFPNRPTP